MNIQYNIFLEKPKRFLVMLYSSILLSIVTGFLQVNNTLEVEQKKTHSVKTLSSYMSEPSSLDVSYIILSEMSQSESTGYFIHNDQMVLAQLVEAEAGNQDLDGKRLVADVVLNRMDSSLFGDQNTIWSVILADNQFGVISDGAFKRMEDRISEESIQAAIMEWDRERRLDQNVLYFNTKYENGKRPFKHGDHWFSY